MAVFQRPTPLRRQRLPRGFTLVELLVSLTGGLFVSLAVFAFARDSSRFYQREGRVANATLASLSGFERLRADLARAGFLSTPNIQADPAVCLRPTTGPNNALADLVAVRITNGADGAPDSILLSGSYSSADEFPVREIVTQGNEVHVLLQTGTGPMARLGYLTPKDPTGPDDTETAETNEQNAQRNQALIQQLFRANRALRIVDNEGRQHYGVISRVEGAAANQPTIVLDNGSDSAAPIPFRSATSQFCGLKGLETGATVNVVNFIRYEIAAINDNARYAALFAASNAGPYDAGRRELVRTELGVDGEPLVGADNEPQQELIAEYATDLQFAVTVVDNPMALTPTMTFLQGEDTAFAQHFTTPLAANTPTQRVRAVRAFLKVRAREPDRDTQVTDAAGNDYRVGLGGNGSGPYARLRTLQADVMLNNLSGLRW